MLEMRIKVSHLMLYVHQCLSNLLEKASNLRIGHKLPSFFGVIGEGRQATTNGQFQQIPSPESF